VVHVNQDVVRTEMAYLQDHSVIVNFVGEKPSTITFNVWFAHLNQKAGAKVMFDYSLGRGFFLLKFDGPTLVKKLLMLTP
jgi:hypothetical protein